MEPVNVYILDTAPSPQPIANVVVAVYDLTGTTFITQSTTDTLGVAGFLLTAGTYQLRFYKQHVSFLQPQRAVVPTGGSGFTVTGQLVTPPIATNPRLCRASGYFLDVSGAPKANLDMFFLAKFNPIVLDGAGVVTERMHIQTDDDGYAQIDLIRFGQYDVTVQAMEDYLLAIEVPDSPSVNLPYLLFPTVASISWSPTGPYSIPVGGSLVLTPTVITTAGVEMTGTALTDVQWSSSDTSILSVGVGTTTVTLAGVAPGTANVLASRRGSPPVYIPDSAITGVPLAVTVA